MSAIGVAHCDERFGREQSRVVGNSNFQIACPAVADLTHVACEPVDQLNVGRFHRGGYQKGIRLGTPLRGAESSYLRYAK